MISRMTMRTLALCVGLGIVVSFPVGNAFAEDKTGDAKEAPKAKKRGIPMFKPTNVGAPKTRLGGATRGRQDGVPRTEALVPEEPGQTLQAQPVLYWYLGGETDYRIDFTLIGVDPIRPMLETTLPGGMEPGVQRIALSDFDVQLEPGVSYQWFVAVVPNPEQRLYDRIVGGGIERLAANGDLETRAAAAAPADRHYVYAEAGVWYDALDILSQQIAATPENESLVAQRGALLDQVGIAELN